MTIEEKARAYDEALERAKNVLRTDLHESGVWTIKRIFSELAENEDERIRETLIHIVKGACDKYGIKYKGDEITEEKLLAYLEKQKEANKAIEAVERIDKYIDEHLANAHDMKDSNPEKKYYRGWDDALAEMSRILQDVYSNEKQKECVADSSKTSASEDERIRKWLYDFIHNCPNETFEFYGGVGKKAVLAYLEKQKEEEGYEAIPVESTLEYKLGFKAGKESEKQKEQKLAEIDEYDIIKKHITEDVLSSEVNKRLKECGWYVTDENPAEWDDYTKTNLDRAIQIIKKAKGTLQGYQSDDGIYECDKAIECLEHFIYRGLEIEKSTECIDFNNEFDNQVSHLLASVLNGEHEYNKDFVKYAAQSLLEYAKNELKSVDYEEELEKCKRNPLYFFDKYVTVKLKPVKLKAERDGWYVCTKDYYRGGKKQSSVGDLVQAKGGMHIMGEEDISEWFRRAYYEEVRDAGSNTDTNIPESPAEWDKEDSDNLERVDNYLWMLDNYIGDDCAMPQRKTDKIRGYIQEVLSPWLKSLPERFSLQPRQEWSEEDEEIRKWCISHFKDCFHVSEDNLEFKQYLSNKIIPWLEKQRPLKWSNEDEKMKESIIKVLYGGGHFAYEEEIDWLKSLPLNLKKKNEDVAKLYSNEWSEEDEKEIDCIINILDRLGFEEFCKSSREQDVEEERFYYKEIQCLKRLKSLKPSWKPSEEQMKALCNAIAITGTCTSLDAINTSLELEMLYEQLKKLM